jgi:hypothetical protein
MAVIGSEEVLEAMIVSGPGVEPGKQRLFDVEPLDDGFDDDVGLGEGSEVVGEADAIERGLPGVGCKSPLRYLRLDHLGDMRHRRLGSLGLFIEGEDAHAALGRHLHDPAPHGAGADDRDEEIGSLGIKGHGCLRQRPARPVD